MLQLIKQYEPRLRFYEQNEFEEFLEVLNETDSWEYVYSPSISLEYVPEKTDLTGKTFALADAKQIKELSERGGFIFHVGTEAYVMHPSAFASIKMRTGKASLHMNKLFSEGLYERIAEEFSAAFGDYQETDNMLARGGRLLAIHSSEYCNVAQEEIYKKALETLSAEDFDADLLVATYTHERTFARYRLSGEAADKAIENFLWALEDRGVDAERISKAYPVFTVSTGDTGLYKMVVSVRLNFEGKDYLLCEPAKVVHRGSPDKVRHSLQHKTSEIVHAIARGAENMGKLVKQDASHPVDCMINAIKAANMHVNLSAPAQELIRSFETSLSPGEKVSRFVIYRMIYSLLEDERFKNQVIGTQLRVEGNMFVLLEKDWDKFDQPGAKMWKGASREDD